MGTLKQQIINLSKLGRVAKCVRCGSHDDITRHHVIPWALWRQVKRAGLIAQTRFYRKRDIVLLCKKCHKKYEDKYAPKLLCRIKKDLGIEANFKTNGEYHKVWAAAKRLLNPKPIKPRHRFEITKKIEAYLGRKPEISDLKEIAKSFDADLPGYIDVYDYIARNADINKLYSKFRRYFLRSMQPKLLSKKWKDSVNYEYKVRGTMNSKQMQEMVLELQALKEQHRDTAGMSYQEGAYAQGTTYGLDIAIEKLLVHLKGYKLMEVFNAEYDENGNWTTLNYTGNFALVTAAMDQKVVAEQLDGNLLKEVKRVS